MPVKGLPESTGTSRVLCSFSIEQYPVVSPRTKLGSLPIWPQSVVSEFVEVALFLNREGPNNRQIESRLDRLDTFRRFNSVKLYKIRLKRIDDLREQLVVGIDGQGDFFCSTLYASAQSACGLEWDVSRRRRKEHKADHIGVGIESDIERAPQALVDVYSGRNKGKKLIRLR